MGCMELEISEMTYDDLDEVLDIEKTSFPSPWTKAMQNAGSKSSKTCKEV